MCLGRYFIFHNQHGMCPSGWPTDATASLFCAVARLGEVAERCTRAFSVNAHEETHTLFLVASDVIRENQLGQNELQRLVNRSTPDLLFHQAEDCPWTSGQHLCSPFRDSEIQIHRLPGSFNSMNRMTAAFSSLSGDAWVRMVADVESPSGLLKCWAT